MKNVVLKSLLLSTALTVASSSFAFAEGWTGFRIGAGGGGNFAATDLDSYGEGWSDDQNEDLGSADAYLDTLNDWHPDSVVHGSENEEGSYRPLVDMGNAGAFGTVELGADLQSSSLVIGLTGNYDFGKTRMSNYSLSDNNSAAFGGDNNASGDSNADLTTDLELGNSWAVGGRIGFLPTENSLIFVSGGYQRTKASLSNSFDADVNIGATDDSDINSETDSDYSDSWDITSSETEWLNGYYVGGGIETMLAESLTLKMEYRFSDLDALTSSDASGDDVYDENSYGDAVSSKVDPFLHSVRATIGIRF